MTLSPNLSNGFLISGIIFLISKDFLFSAVPSSRPPFQFPEEHQLEFYWVTFCPLHHLSFSGVLFVLVVSVCFILFTSISYTHFPQMPDDPWISFIEENTKECWKFCLHGQDASWGLHCSVTKTSVAFLVEEPASGGAPWSGCWQCSGRRQNLQPLVLAQSLQGIPKCEHQIL